jgi:CelD/BcsL family acetyltransferase involved in cellulose biosynthesis
MLQVIEHNTLASLQPFRTEWAELLAQTPDADYFQSLDWLEVYWHHFGEHQQLRILQIIDGDETVGIVPLVLKHDSSKIGTIRTLTFPLADWGSFYGPIGPDRSRLLTLAMSHLQHTPQDWDAIDLRWINTHHDQHAWLLEAMQSVGLKTYRRPRTIVPVAQLNGDWETYWSSRTSKVRSDIRRNQRKVEKQTGVEYLRFRPEPGAAQDPRWDLYDACEHLASLSWQGSSTTGTTLSHEGVRAHLRDQHARAVQAGGVDIVLLRINGRDVAYQYNYHLAGRVSSLRQGFDPEFAQLGVGKVMMANTLEDSCQRGDRVYDFLPRHVEIKRPFATDVLDCHSFFYCPAKLGRALPLLGKRIFDDWQTGRNLVTNPLLLPLPEIA